MSGPSLYTLFYWAAFGAICVYLLLLIHQLVERRARVRRMRERRHRRALLDALDAKRWTP